MVNRTEVVLAEWGNIAPVSFRKAVTGQFKNDLMECQRMLMTRKVTMLEQAGCKQDGRGGFIQGRDQTPAEIKIREHLEQATWHLGQCLLEFNNADREDVVLHDGGPDIKDGAISDGVLV